LHTPVLLTVSLLLWSQARQVCYGSLLDVVTAGVMVAATLLLTAYCTRFPAATQPKASYAMYDSVNQSPARIFMPAKAYSQSGLDAAVAAWAAAAGASNGSSSDNSSLFNEAQQPLQPGMAGRWLLPDADGDFDALAGLMAGVGSMAQLWVAYSLLQGIVLILLVLRWGAAYFGPGSTCFLSFLWDATHRSAGLQSHGTFKRRLTIVDRCWQAACSRQLLLSQGCRLFLRRACQVHSNPM
jgi:hypothetical protein